MKVAFGIKAHSGWAAMVVVGERGCGFEIVDRQRMELVDELWAKAPYHAAEEMEPGRARKLVERGVRSAHRITIREMGLAAKRESQRNNDLVACAVLTGAPMPFWSTDEIRAVHFRMHKAEGALFRDTLMAAAAACHIRSFGIPEKRVIEEAARIFGVSKDEIERMLAGMGKLAGPPWARDQKNAALAGMIALRAAQSR
jgi:hypothetical protein